MRLLIWGTGQLSWQVGIHFPKDEIIGYIESSGDKKTFADKTVYRPDNIKELEYDAILVSTIYSEEIYKTCIKLNIDIKKMIFAYGNIICKDLNNDYIFVEKICGKDFAREIRERYHLVRETDCRIEPEKNKYCIEENLKTQMYQSDYVRIKTFEMLVQEIEKHKVTGQMAELGVFRGDFAQYINSAFSKRKLYLFDTFSGFDEEELKRDVPAGAENEVREIYKNTSINTVMEKMKFKENIVLKIGLFPDSLSGLEDEFALVSLDCDWEELIYQGLVYFYPRLSQGGYIMIHDYNCRLKCAAKAIERFECNNNLFLAKVPICDNKGSIIITK